MPVLTKMKKDKKKPGMQQVPESVSRIDEEVKKRQKKITVIVVNIIVLILLLMYSMNFIYLWREIRRPEISTIAVQSIPLMFTSITAYFNLSVQDYIVIACVTGFIGCIMLIMVNSKQLRKHDNPETVNGSAKLMDKEGLDDYNKRRTDPIGSPENNGPNNMILSRDIFLSLDGWQTKRNCNILVIGGSGAGKSRYFASPNILQFNANFIITDPSGELLNDYGKVLENNGYTVKVFNLVNVYKGNRYNPFHYIKEEKDVFVLVNTLIKNTNPAEGKSGDPFWEKCEKLLLQALILYLWHNVPEEEQTFANVIKLIDMADVDENDASAESKLDRLFAALTNEDPDNLAAQEYRNFKKAAGKTLKSIIISVVARMESFMLSDIQYLTSADEFEFEKFADSKQALFVIIPTADTTFNFLVSLMYAQMFLTLYEYVENRAEFGHQAVFDEGIVKVEQAVDAVDSARAKNIIEQFVKEVKAGTEIEYDKKHNVYNVFTKNTHELITWRGTEETAQLIAAQIQSTIKSSACRRMCPNHVRLILDEFANIGQIPDFNEKLATIRKYGISCSIILQALSQLKKMYKDDWNTIAANCDTKLFLGCDDQETIKWLVDMLGKKTTTVEGLSMQSNGSGSSSYNKSSIELLTVDQVAGMKDDECIVRVRGENPYFGIKYDLLKHPRYKEANETKGQFVIPEAKNVKYKNSHIPLRLRKEMAAAEAAKAAEEKNRDIPPEVHPASEINSENSSGKAEANKTMRIPMSASDEKITESAHKKNNAVQDVPVSDYGISDKPATPATSKEKKTKNKCNKDASIDQQQKNMDYRESSLNADEMQMVQNTLDEARLPINAPVSLLKERAESMVIIPDTPEIDPIYNMTD